MFLKSKEIARIATGFLLAASTTCSAVLAADMIKTGQKVPTFSLPDEHGKATSPTDFKGERTIIFFYDADNAPMVAKESKLHQKHIDQFKLESTDILCIGTDPVASHKAMHSQYNLKFHLLTDKNNAVRTETFGLPAPEKGKHNHYAVVVDKDGTVKKVVDGSVNESKEDSLADALKSLSQESVSAF